MDTEKVIQDLNRRFAAPLLEFYQRRIIFWYDEDKEFEDKLDEVVLENAKVIALTGDNAFSVKKLLSVDDLTTNYLVYSPLAYDRPDDNWLLDVELYSEEFRADLISIWMDEMGLVSNPAMRKQVKNYRAYFNAKDRRLKVSTQNKVPTTPAQLHKAVMAAICGLKDAQPDMIIRSTFRAGLDLNNNTIYQDFIKYHADSAFWAMVRQGCGFTEEEPDLGRLAIHLLLTAATRTMRQEYLAGLDSFISMPHQAYCYDFISEWLHSEDVGQLYDVARYVEEEAHLHQRFEKLSVDDLAGTECFPCINEVILIKIMTEISDQIIDVDTITSTVEKRRTCAWYESFENFYDGILQVANMQSFFKEHSAGFHTAEAKGIWKEYTENYYQMDTYYRLFHLSFQKSLETSNILLDDLFKHVVDKVEGLYTHWFLGELGNNWSDVCADEMATFGKVLEVPQQEEFYRSRIKTSDTKIFVIISDAMRYEVAAAMADQLQRETQSKVSISSMQSIFPSITKFGMAALLPHKELTVEVRNDILTVLADGQSTASTYRDKVLKSEDPASVALKYNDIIAMKRAERSALVKGMDVKRILADNFVRPDESQKILSQLRKKGSHTIIDMVTVRLDMKKDCFFAEFSNLGVGNVPIADEYPEKFDRLLCGGIWCIVQLDYEVEGDNNFGIEGIDGTLLRSKQKKQKDISPISIRKLTPIQMPHIDIDELKKGRKAFTKDEWLDILLRSIGMEPDEFTYREKWLLLTRMIPLVENNFNLCELGPRSTGKSHLYKEISPNSILISGGQTTVANLFYNMGRKTVGLVGLWDCVAFDEVAGIKFKDKDGIQIMKDYMASGSFARGKEEKAATASMVFVGNINQSVDVLLKTSSLFAPFPSEMGTDTAFLDRMHCYLPGWEIPKFRPEHFTDDYGFISDYLAEFIRELRKEQYGDALDHYFRLGRNLNQRDTIAVRRMVDGYLKLMYPDGEFIKEELEEVIQIALEMRRRVKEQLKKLGGMEFYDVNFSYIDLEDMSEHYVSVPEQGGGKLIPDGMCNPGQVYTVSRGKSGMLGVFRLPVY